ncbi:Clp protease [Vibrio phage 1.152.O._10N.222.46.E1]|uniref:Clp protease n=5 Tax=Nahantvirus 49C7 TaxID=2846601 RepID=A0A2I7RB97_9CAUD|nr:ATP-dependent protease [Vibrio phage 1.026.O._10N.222.49.C7]AUR82486.1 Clp protease [Vibrio phage 1.025.O._10N.222.46.B6]AUR90736.1 Clp protease [Vibrio phage 1.150.O._10N.222.46.A6]AUR90908.1 Clp protease [Vibrio phage 1.152.O._10N.222.46.E1]AUS02377.1 Clp protease [Vibrio phage 2.130.O._10N.222.46.C2]AUR82594.1 Clp protease [Vibrio phage 1.026.O._10N.222.49.C7]
MIDLLIPKAPTKDIPLFSDHGDYRTGYIDLLEPIEQPSDYAREFEILRQARKGDKVLVTINTPGGRLDTAVHLIDAIEQCKGQVTARLVGDGFSAGSLIFLSCKNKQVGKFGSLMLHRESGGIVGKGSDTEKQMEYQKKYMNEVYADIYSKYLDERDMERLMDGTDLWFSANETKALVNKTYYEEK